MSEQAGTDLATSDAVALRWLSKSWYRSLLTMLVPALIGIPIGCQLLLWLPHSNQPLRIAAIAGMVGGASLALLHGSIAVTGAMRAPGVIRAAAALMIPTLATAFCWKLAANRSDAWLRIPVVLAIYGSCLGAVLGGILIRIRMQREFVGPRGYLLTQSSLRSELIAVALVLMFHWAQMEYLDRAWLEPVANASTFLWSMVAGAAGCWAMLARSYFGQRRLAYAPTIPALAVAMIAYGVQTDQWVDSPEYWRDLLVLAMVSLSSWWLAQETMTKVVQGGRWRWQPLDRFDFKPDLDAFRGRVQLGGRGWEGLAWLYLIAMLCVMLLTHLAQTRIAFVVPTLYSVGQSCVAAIGTACLSSALVLGAHRSRSWIPYCALMSGCVLSIASVMGIELTGATLLILVLPITLTIQLIVRVADWLSGKTIDTVPQRREPLSIRDLMALTMILGVEFALMRAVQLPPQALVAAFVGPLLIALLSLILYRASFVGWTRQMVVMMTMIAMAITAIAATASPSGNLIAMAAFLISHGVIARGFKKQGWQCVRPLPAIR